MSTVQFVKRTNRQTHEHTPHTRILIKADQEMRQQYTEN